MPSPRYKFCGSFRKFGTVSYGRSGAVSNAFARGGTFCCANRGIAANTSTATKPNLNARFIEAPLENVKKLYTTRPVEGKLEIGNRTIPASPIRNFPIRL